MLGGRNNPTKLVPGDLPARPRAALARALAKPRNRFASCDDFVRARVANELRGGADAAQPNGNA